MNYLFRLLSSALNVSENPFHKVKVYSTSNRNTEIQKRPKFVTQGIYTFNDNNAGARDFNCPVICYMMRLVMIKKNNSTPLYIYILKLLYIWTFRFKNRIV